MNFNPNPINTIRGGCRLSVISCWCCRGCKANVMSIHVTTNASLAAGCPKVEGICSICLTEQELTLGYVGIYCTNCNQSPDLAEPLSRVVRMQREYINMSRREISNATGYALSTISNYENSICSKKYAEEVSRLVRLATPQH